MRHYEALKLLMDAGEEKITKHPRLAITIDEAIEIIKNSDLSPTDDVLFANVNFYNLGVETGYRIAKAEAKKKNRKAAHDGIE